MHLRKVLLPGKTVLGKLFNLSEISTLLMLFEEADFPSLATGSVPSHYDVKLVKIEIQVNYLGLS